MKATPTVLAWGAGAAVAAVVAAVVIVGNQQNGPLPDSSKAPAAEAPTEGTTLGTAGIDPVLWEPPTRPIFPRLSPAAADPAHCAPVQKQAEGLLADFENKVTPADRETARKVIAETMQQGQSQAEGYNLFAGGEMLKGNFTLAAWGALKAATMEWKAVFVANIGVYLMHLDRLDEAGGFLSCARELDPRSPFVIEAQAMLALRRNDCDRARDLIELAVRLMPGDMNVRYSAGVIHHRCGDRAKALYYLRAAEREKPDDETVKKAILVVDPSSANRPRSRDALDLLVEESLAFLDEMMARAELASEYAKAVLKGPSGGQSLKEDFAEQMREHVAEAKIKIRHRLAARDPNDPIAWNFTLVETVSAYLQAILDYEDVSRGMAPYMIMSAAMRMDPIVYADKYAGKHGGERTNNFVLLDEDDRFRDALMALQAEEGRCLKSAAHTVGGPQACARALCAAAMPLWEAYKSASEANMAAAESGFPRAAEDYGNYWLAYRFRGADYARRAINALKPTPQTPEMQAQVAAIIAQTANQQLDALVQMFVGPKLTETYQSLQSALEGAPGEVMADGKFSRLCPAGSAKSVPIDPPIDPFLAALMEATKLEVGPSGIDCETKIGGFGVQLKSKDGRDWQVKVSEKVGALSYGASAGSDGRIGGEVSYSQSASAHGIAAKGTVKIWGESRRGGRVDYGAQVEGKLGTGVTYAGQGVSCYFVSGKATFNARAFANSMAA